MSAWPSHAKAEAARETRTERGWRPTVKQEQGDQRRARYIDLRTNRVSIADAARDIGVAVDTAYKLYEPAWFEHEHATYAELRRDGSTPEVAAAVMGITPRRRTQHEAAYLDGGDRG